MGFAIPTEGLELPQLVFLMSIYGYILSLASSKMADGAELLLEALGPGWSGIIGGILIPILGVVPDSMMILMSGLGPIETVAEEITVGCGTLVGSTVMLLCIPTSIGIWLGRRQLGGREHRALMKDKIRERKVLNTVTGEVETKQIVTQVPVPLKQFSWTDVGGTALSTTPKGAKVMMATSLTYLFLQIPAILWGEAADVVHREHWFAGTGFVIALAAFFWYLYWAATDADALEVVTEKQRNFAERWHLVNGLSNIQRVLNSTADPFLHSEALFQLFDNNNSGTIDFEEMCAGWKKIGYEFDDDQARMSFNMLDHNKDGSLSSYEFFNWIEDYLLPQYISAQPIQTPAGAETLPTSPSIDDILSLFPFPSSLKPTTVEKVCAFLRNKESQLTMILSKEERYALHIWCSSLQPVYQYALITHSEDLSGQLQNFASSAADPETASMASSATKASRNKPQTSHYARQLIIRKADKTHQTHHLRPKLRPLIPDTPVWACASSALVTHFKTTRDPWPTLFASIANSKHTVDLEIVQNFAQKFQLGLSPQQIKFFFYSHDTDTDHQLSEEQFRVFLESLVNTAAGEVHISHIGGTFGRGALSDELEGKAIMNNGNNYNSLSSEDNEDDDEEDDDDEEEEGEFAHLSHNQLLQLAIALIIGGTLVVTIFSDPTVEVISAIGKKMGIPAFYISFIFTPIFSNSSEIFASLKFAAKKTDVSLGLTLSSLYGAATMNNTICLAVFMGLIFFRGLSWEATSETFAVLTVIFIVGILGLKQTLPLWKAAIMFALFPLSICMIYVLNLYK